jgi:hypothetical protein
MYSSIHTHLYDQVIYVFDNNKIKLVKFNQKRIVSMTATGEIHLPEKMDLDTNANSTNRDRTNSTKHQKWNHTTSGAFNIVLLIQNKS